MFVRSKSERIRISLPHFGRIGAFIACILISISVPAQDKIQTRAVQFSIAPGLGTNGIHPASFKNYFSLNLTSGYSSESLLFEIAGISNLNETHTRGLQVAGIFNLTGGNAFSKMSEVEKGKKIRSGFEANLDGLQISGLSNIVINNINGGQISGGLNLSKGALSGVQISGLANVVQKYSFGLQISGLYNSSVQSMDGVQIAGLLNFTSGELYGAQIGAINRAGYIEGKHSINNDDPSGLQIGILNSSKKMNGLQIGLINIAKRSQGTQIGLINIYNGGKDLDTKDGTAVGLINIGGVGFVSAYANELFYSNFEIATGNKKNGRITAANHTTFIYNSLLFSTSSNGFVPNEKSWAIGYGFKIYTFNRSSTPIKDFRFISYGVEAQHINYAAKSFTKDLSLLLRPKISFGTKLHPRLHLLYLFAALSYNFYFSDGNNYIAPSFMESTGGNGRKLQMWPGLSVGIHLE